MTAAPELLAVIPACGYSRRMGVPKPLLRWPADAQWWQRHGGDPQRVSDWALRNPEQTLLAHSLAAFSATGVADVRVVVRREDTALQQVLRRLGHDPVLPPVPPPDMLTSIAWGLVAALFGPQLEDATGILIAPVDQPPISTAALRSIVEAAKQSVAIAVPTQRGRRGHPCLLHPALAWPILLAAARRCATFRRHWHAVRDALHQQTARKLPPPSEPLVHLQIPDDAGVNWLLHAAPCDVAKVPLTEETTLCDLDSPEDYLRAAVAAPRGGDR